jgi:hypothetical protein
LHLNGDFISVVLISIFAIAVFSYFSSPTVFSGRDQGSLSNAAISLSKYHRLESSFPAQFEFFKIYGPGLALNFPGFNYTKDGNLITNFSLGYIAWLASFFSLFGIFGLILANGISFFLFLLSFYTLAKSYIKKSSALVAFFLVITSFVFSWFFKFTLSENLALGLIWFGLSQFVLFLRERDKLFLFSFLSPFGLLLFIRIEAFAFLALALTILFFFQRKERMLSWKKLLKYSLIFSIFISIVFAGSVFVNKSSYITLLKGFLNSLSFYKNTSGENIPFLSENIYLLRVFITYALLNYIVLGLAGFFYFFKKRKFTLLIPFFIILPAFFYLINPSITSDHPWMLRRYVFALVPICVLYTVIFLDYFFRKRPVFYLFSLILLLFNLSVFIPYLKVEENNGLLTQIEELSTNFKDSDLILVDRDATNDGWSMMSGPLNVLFGKQAVYFFNPNDLEKINVTKFSNVYLIAPNDNLDFYKKNNIFDRLSPVKDYVIQKRSLEIFTGEKKNIFKNGVTLPTYRKNYVYGKIYLLE